MDFKKSIEQKNYDPVLLWTMLLLAGTGLIMVYSASVDVAALKKALNFQSYYYLLRQAFNLALASILGLIVFFIPINFWQKNSKLFFLFSFFLVSIVLIPGVGSEAKGATRWISLGFMNFQPTELMKFAIIIYTSDYVLRKSREIGEIKRGFLPIFVVVVLVGFIILSEKDLGALVVFAAISFGILFLGGVSLKIILSILITSPFALYGLISVEQYRMDRLRSWLNPFDDFTGDGWQLGNSMIAFGRGDLFGVGLGESIQKLQYLPDAHTDFILAILAEELGLFGVAIIILIFMIMIVRIFGIAKESTKLRNHFSSLVAQGVGIWIGIQAIFNMGVNLGLFPTKGLTLPLISYGGSALLMNIIALSVVLRVDYENKIKSRRN
ncbi:MAG: putative lipid II flippase FtsW [Nitrosomonadales bacterium]